MADSLEQPKKPAGGGFGQFMAAKRAEFVKECKGQPISAVQKLGSERWKQVSESEKESYNNAFKEAQKKYNTDMEKFLAAGGVKQKGAAALRSEKKKAKEGKLKKEKDPNAPKKPVGGAYGCFLNANRAAFQKACPGNVTGVAKMAGEKWKELPDSEKEKYNKEYQHKLIQYQEALKSYTPPPREEDEEEEDEEEAEPPSKKAKVASTNGTIEVAAKAKAKGKAKAKVAPEETAEMPKDVIAKSDKAGMTAVLQKLMTHPDIKRAGIPAAEALSALEVSGGLLHPARKALLGA